MRPFGSVGMKCLDPVPIASLVKRRADKVALILGRANLRRLRLALSPIMTMSDAGEGSFATLGQR
jgi:hypothetical protein